MAIKDMKTINVLNFNHSVVVVSTRNDSFKINPAVDDENPTSLPLSLEEILYINSNSNAFKSGLLRFEKDIEQEMYEDYLRISSWKDLLTLDQVRDIILNPTIEGLQKIVNIQDTGVFSRVRGEFVRLKNADADISMRVEKIVNARMKELNSGIRKSQIEIVPRDTETRPADSKVDELEKSNKALQDQLAQMQEMMAQLLANQQEQGKAVESDVSPSPSLSSPTSTPKKAGRPKKTTTATKQ